MSQTNEQYIVFVVNNSLYGIPIHEVSEIIRIQTVNWIPNSREEFLGIFHLRDKVIPVISLRRILSETEKELDSKTRIIVIHSGGKQIGIAVDEVDQVMFLPQQHISPPPHSRNGWMTGVYHHQETIIALLNLDSLLGNIDVNQVLV
ncbi:chemotaxis protein CheW [Aneurinibacillus terranovensis]|uniref:chemotaxis protein CheW n=1 Tax=Aneurinibacillus terranovensis TaxID=278991 RepID=UPI000402A4C5|nr:chemotaxis protein CheW [Aneurinibacillus terranovensis]